MTSESNGGRALVLDTVVPRLFYPREGSELWGGSFNIEKGSFWQIVGPSGSGKTSFFSFLSGAQFSYDGSIRLRGIFEDRSFTNLKEVEWSIVRRKHLSFVFQDLRLIHSLSVRDNLLLKANLISTYPEHTEELIQRLTTELEIDTLLKKRPTLLSRGEQQRVAIVRALLQDFDFLILDEPFSHLDPRLAARAAHLLSTWCKEHDASVISLDLSTHELFPWTKRVHLSLGTP